VKRLCSESIVERKSMNTLEHEKVNKALHQWYKIHREKGTPISGLILHEKALQFPNEIKEQGNAEFTASSRWLDRWKHSRYGDKRGMVAGQMRRTVVCQFQQWKRF
jgi:hypothetical protein